MLRENQNVLICRGFVLPYARNVHSAQKLPPHNVCSPPFPCRKEPANEPKHLAAFRERRHSSPDHLERLAWG